MTMGPPTDQPPDNEPEIEITPAKPQLVRRSKTAIEEPIESGEIVQRRSHVIRASASQSNIEVREDPTEPVLHTPQMPVSTPALAPRRHYLWLIAAVVPALAAVALMMFPRATATKPNIQGLEDSARMIAIALDGDVRAVQVKVAAIAASSMLRNAIVTDAPTMADMAHDQPSVFPVEAGEVLEVFQVRAGTRTSLLRIPATASAIEPPPPNTTRIEPHIGGVAILSNAPVTSGKSDITGEVAISVPVDLEPIKRRLLEQVKQGAIVGTQIPIPIILVKSTGSEGTLVKVPIETRLLQTGPLQLEAVVDAGDGGTPSRIMVYACLALAGLLLLAFVVSRR